MKIVYKIIFWYELRKNLKGHDINLISFYYSQTGRISTMMYIMSKITRKKILSGIATLILLYLLSLTTTSRENQGTSVLSSEETASTRETVTVSRVIDGDTVELTTGEKVRYIGMDTPEIRPNECYG